MKNNIPAQTEQQITQATNLDELTKAFGLLCFMYGCLYNDAPATSDIKNSRFKWLSEEATNLAAVAMQLYTVGETKPTGTKKPA